MTAGRGVVHRTVASESAGGTGDRGSVFMLALWVSVALLLAIVVGYFPFLVTAMRVPARAHLGTQATALAEAGIHDALWEFNYNGAAFDGTPDAKGNTWDPVSSEECTALGGTQCVRKIVPAADLTAADGSGTPIGDVVVTVLDPATDGPVVLAGGFVPSQAAAGNTTTNLRAALQKINGETFRRAAFGAQSMRFGYDSNPSGGEVFVDSYDSTAGAYNEETSPGVFNKSQNGDVGSNVSVAIDSLSTVEGDALIGPDGGVTVAGTLTGSIITEPEVGCPNLRVPPSLWGLPTQGDVTLTGTQTLTCNGSMRFTSLTVRDDARLIMEPGCEIVIDGTTVPFKVYDDSVVEARGDNKIYVTDGVFTTFSNQGILTTTQRPRDFQIYTYGYGSSGASYSSTVNQKEPFYGVVYNQSTGVAFQNKYQGPGLPYYDNAQFYGAFFGCGYTAARGRGETAWLHYDESLADLSVAGDGIPTDQYVIVSWQVVPP